MARGMGLPPLPHPHGGHPLAGHPGVNGAAHLTPHHVLSSSSGGGGVIGRPTSTPSTGTSAFNGKSVQQHDNSVGLQKMASLRGHHTRNGCFLVALALLLE